MKKNKFFLVSTASVAFMLSACNASMPSFLSGGDDEPPLEGERIEILVQEGGLKADSGVDGSRLILPDAIANASWPQEGGDEESSGGNFGFSGTYAEAGSARVGKGNPFDTIIIPQPVAAGHLLFAMDANGYVSAHEAQNLEDTVWVSDVIAGKGDQDVLGGGLAFEDGKVYVSAGNGVVAAIDAVSGTTVWRQSLGVPMRSGPKVLGESVYVVTVDNQLFSLNKASGVMRWSHRGINESAGYLTAVSPSVSGNVVIAPYSSGELVAVSADSGQERWSDTLALSRKTTAASVFTGIDATPAISSGRVFSIGSGGLMVAIDMASGRRVWEQPISGHNMPWVSGQFVFVITSDDVLAAISGIDGRVVWVTPLATDDEKKERVLFSGPVMAGGELIVASANGKLQRFAARNGEKLGEHSIPDGVSIPPIVAQGRIFVVDSSATITSLR